MKAWGLLFSSFDPREALERLIDVQITAAVEQAKGGGYGWLVLATIGVVAVGAWFFWRKR